eukprot:Phypoly_transcript_07252.p1 GENE.Phypoly_transcript_07252~~Phypoly_transcript_07252.p1  ORF type:complete len:280 (+),score=20.82 Phypoly_transcript_07252:808-1647(+)
MTHSPLCILDCCGGLWFVRVRSHQGLQRRGLSVWVLGMLCGEREEFAENVKRNREQGEISLLQNGVSLDPILQQEILHSGSDQRHNVNIVARPPKHIRELIKDVQRQLSILEPAHYYYAEDSLHFTFVDVQNSLTQDTATQIGQKLSSHREQLFSDVVFPILEEPTICFDSNTVIICWLPRIDCIQKSRLNVQKEISKLGIDVKLRYTPPGPPTSHVTILRYTNQLTCNMHEWIDRLKSIIIPAGSASTWEIKKDEIFIQWGRNWYGFNPPELCACLVT